MFCKITFVLLPYYHTHPDAHASTTLWLTSFGTLSCLLLKISEPLTINKNKLQKLFIQCKDRHHIVKVACALERSVEHALPIILSHIPVTQVEQPGGTDREPSGAGAIHQSRFVPVLLRRRARVYEVNSSDEAEDDPCFFLILIQKTKT